ncbi:MAG: lipocalin-like domain-containing protein [bacterium]
MIRRAADIAQHGRAATFACGAAVILTLVGAVLLHAREWRRAAPGYEYAFPRDHGAHAEFASEWWYYTGHLTASDGRRFGYQLTFFRVGVGAPPDSAPRDDARGATEEGDAGSTNASPAPVSAWRAGELLFAHFAISDLDAKKHAMSERRNRRGPGTAGAASDSLAVFVEDWSVRAESGGHRLRARGGGYAIDLLATPARPPVIHGKDGVSRKSREGSNGSHYVSITRLTTTGTLTDGSNAMPVEGSSWMDHEFGSDQLLAGQTGWDWMGLSLDDGSDLMLYRLRGAGAPFLQGTIVPAEGAPIHLDENEIEMIPLEEWASAGSGARYPVRWSVGIPRRGLSIDVRARFDAQELTTQKSTGVTYWEGSVGVRGESSGRAVTGEGYLEMTGYAGAFDAKI